jgi:hypothetical protein
MTVDRRDGRVARVNLVTIVDPPGVITLLRVEQRDWMDRLLTRAEFSPLLHGGSDQAEALATGLRQRVLSEVLGSLRDPLE